MYSARALLNTHQHKLSHSQFRSFSLSLSLTSAWKLMDDSSFLLALFIYWFILLFVVLPFSFHLFLTMLLFFCLHLICLIRKITHSQPCDLCKWFFLVVYCIFFCFALFLAAIVVCSRRSCSSSSFVLPSGSFIVLFYEFCSVCGSASFVWVFHFTSILVFLFL